MLRVALCYSATEAAAVIGTTSGAVRITGHRALNRVRALLAEHGDVGVWPGSDRSTGQVPPAGFTIDHRGTPRS